MIESAAAGGCVEEMMRLAIGVAAAAMCAAAVTGCGVHLFNRFDGEPVAARRVAAEPDTVWNRLQGGLGGMGLVVSEIRPADRLVELGWVTLPGDGRLFLECGGAAPVGNASFRPRIEVKPVEGGSIVVVATEARGTLGSGCVSTGRFEDWLLGRLEATVGTPAVAAGRTDDAPGTASPRPPE